MEISAEGPTCPRCAGRNDGGPCEECGRRRRTAFAVLAGAGGAGARDAAPVRLLREYKGPTVRDLLASPAAVLDLLPGRVRSVEEAVRAADLAAADAHMSRALGLLLPGPGHRRRRRALLAEVFTAALWVWFAALLVLLLCLAA